MSKKLFAPLWIFVALLLFFYSFTQIDLALTFSHASIWKVIQGEFQKIGYYNRPLSTYLYSAVVIILFLTYGWTLFLVHRKKIEKKIVKVVILVISILLLFSYNAFSYDIFNYIFDAKIVTVYHQNPYEHKALDFYKDPMLSFMRWTHRVYPYGPIWLGLTIPLSYIGITLDVFAITFFLFKALMVASYLGSVYLIYKISEKTKVINPLFAAAFFAFNPLVLIESVVSAHNDIVMLFFALLSLYLFIQKKMVFSFAALILSAGIKFATVFLAPVYIFFLLLSLKKKLNVSVLLLSVLLVMFIPLYFVIVRTTFQPWYPLYILTFASFFSRRYYVLIPALVISFFSLSQYIPFLYTGNWDPPIPTILNNIMLIGVGLSIILMAVYAVSRKYVKNKLG